MRKCETSNKYLAGLGGAVLLYFGVLGGTPALAGALGLTRVSTFLVLAGVVLATGLLTGNCKLLRNNSSRE